MVAAQNPERMSSPDELVSQCLQQLEAGDEDAIDRLMPLIYDDLRGLARGIQRSAGHSLNPTALVHEAYGRLVGAGAKAYNGRGHFFKVAAIAMRQLLADHAKEKKRLKRGGGAERVTLQTNDAVDAEGDFDVVALDEALAKFAQHYPRQARVVELRFLTGLSVEETAEVLGISPRSTKSDWQMARAWLSRELNGPAD